MSTALVVSCEHGGNRVPARYRASFRGAAQALRSHRGWDPGALELARDAARRFGVPLFTCTATRLLVDANRSEGHPQLFSEWSRALPAPERERVLERYWRPHQEAVTAAVRAAVARRRPVVHLSCHSFTPVWKGAERTVDVGVLHDPERPAERRFADAWLAALGRRRRDLRLRRNRPYYGSGDGLTTTLRRVVRSRLYLGIELEVSQRLVAGPPAAWRRLRRELVETLAEALEPAQSP